MVKIENKNYTLKTAAQSTTANKQTNKQTNICLDPWVLRQLREEAVVKRKI